MNLILSFYALISTYPLTVVKDKIIIIIDATSSIESETRTRQKIKQLVCLFRIANKLKY